MMYKAVRHNLRFRCPMSKRKLAAKGLQWDPKSVNVDI